DQRVQRVDHVSRVAVLLDNAVDAQAKVEILWVRDLVLRHDPGADRARSVQALALEILATPVALDVASRDVVECRVAENVVKRVRSTDIGPALRNDDAQLDLPVDLITDRRIDGDVGERTGDAGYRFGKDGRRADRPAARGLLGVLLVVAPEGEHIA